MYAFYAGKIHVGHSFHESAEYNAHGLTEAQKEKRCGKSELIFTNLLINSDHQGIANEMQAAASLSKCKKPALKVSFNTPQSRPMSKQQIEQAARILFKELGSNLDDHQAAIWLHTDTGRTHGHLLANRVPLSGRPALNTYKLGIKMKLYINQIIENELNLDEYYPVEREDAKLAVKETILGYKNKSSASVALEDWAEALAREFKINVSFRFSTSNELIGSYFKQNTFGFKGSELGISPALIHNLLEGQLVEIKNSTSSRDNSEIEPEVEINVSTHDNQIVPPATASPHENLKPKEQVQEQQPKRRLKRKNGIN